METQINFTNTYLSPRPVVSLHFSSRRSSGMSSTRKNTKRAQPPLQSLKKQTPNEELHDDLDLDVSSDLKGIMLAKSERKRRKKKEESISSGARLWIEFDDVCYHVQVVELPMLHPEKFVKLGIDPPKGVLCYGPPGTGKTLLARAVANRTDACFIGVIGSELVQKYVGEGARMVHELFQVTNSMSFSSLGLGALSQLSAHLASRYGLSSLGDSGTDPSPSVLGLILLLGSMQETQRALSQLDVLLLMPSYTSFGLSATTVFTMVSLQRQFASAKTLTNFSRTQF